MRRTFYRETGAFDIMQEGYGAELSASDFERLVEISTDWVWQTDSEHRFTHFSSGVAAATGLRPSRALGKVWFDFFADNARDNGAFQRHRDDLAAHRPFREFVYEVSKATDRCRYISVSGAPRFDAAGNFAGYVGTGRNVTQTMEALGELREARRALSLRESRARLVHDTELGRSHAERLMRALNAMHDAFCYYDSSDRLVLYNDTMVDMYAGLEDVIRPGVDFEALIRCGVERGILLTGEADAEAWLATMLANRRAGGHWEQIIAFADGRYVMHREIRSEDGGTIGVCTDITQIKLREAELERAKAVSDNALSDLARSIDVMRMGVVVLAADLTAEIINRAFFDIWRLEPGAVAIGSHFRALMDVNRMTGIYDIGDERWEDYVASRVAEIAAGDVAPREFVRADGRTMIYSVTALSGGKRLVSYYDITDQKQRETEARDARMQLETVLESLPAAVIIYDREDRFVYANRGIYETLPALAGAMIPGRSLRDAVVAAHAAGYFRWSGDAEVDELYDRDREAWIEAYLKNYDKPQAVYERRNADGRWQQVYDIRTADGFFVGVRVDITELKEREASLGEAMRENEVFKSLIDNVPVSIYAKRDDLKLMYVNKGWCELTGFDQEHAIGKTDVEVFGVEGEAFRDADLKVLRDRETVVTEEVVTHPDGSTRHQISRKSAMIANDGTLYLIGSTTDITELKQREAELEEARKSAILADRAKSEFLANMSHEIRTPMNGVLGMAELMAKTELDSKQRTFTDIIVKSGNALLTIINDILDFSKIDAGQLVLDPAPFNLTEAIEDVATLVSTRAKEKDLELIARVQPGLHHTFVGDVGRIRQIITNLMGNAVKFTDKGHVLIDVTGEEDGDVAHLRMSVTDTGIGIPSDKLNMIFEKFSQVDASSTRRHEGTGLGLAITSRLVDMMGGQIGVESVEGQGSTFWVTLTLPKTGRPNVERLTPIDVSGARVLIVDDNAINRAILTEQMASWGFDSCAAEDGPTGIEVLKATARLGLAVDCVVLDFQMPGMTGAEMARLVRQNPAIADVPIVMLTSVDQSLNNAAHRDLALDAQLIKPVRSSLLLETLVASIQRGHMRRSGSTEPSIPIRGTEATAESRPVTQAPVARPKAAPMPGESRVDILVAEDNEVNQLVFTQILAETGLTFQIVGNGKLALAAWEEMKPAMILMDVSMPEMSGLEATGAIREREAETGRHTPIVGVTAHALKGDRERCINAGMDDYLSKPISPKALLDKVSAWMGQAEEARRA